MPFQSALGGTSVGFLKVLEVHRNWSFITGLPVLDLGLEGLVSISGVFGGVINGAIGSYEVGAGLADENPPYTGDPWVDFESIAFLARRGLRRFDLSSLLVASIMALAASLSIPIFSRI